MDDLAKTVNERFTISRDSLVTKRTMWDEVESIFSNQLSDEISASTKSKVMDQRLSTMILEREARVMSQLATGKFKPISGDDMGTSRLMGLTMDKYIAPNANAQFPLLTKLRMMDRYSNIYGNFFGMVDWDVKPNGYVGPDLWLLPIRDVFPQLGAVSLEDSEYFIVRTWRPLSYFENLGKSKNVKNLSQIIEKLKNTVGKKTNKDPQDQSIREDTQYGQTATAKGTGYYPIITMFEKDRWVDYIPDAKIIMRDIENPHQNDELPIVCKYSIPLMDDIFGMGDMERGKTMQYTLNSLWNLYLDAIKISIFPPTILNKDNIIASTIKWGPGAKWLVRNSVGNSVQQLAINPRGIEAFQSTYNVVNASLLNMFGTTDTSVTAATDPGFGRTPRALAMQQQRENSKDNVDRFYMEQTVSDIMRKFANLWSKKAPANIAVRMFNREIEEMAVAYPDIRDMYNPKSGKLTINKKITGSTLYDYEIVSGSTYQMDSDKQQASLRELLQIVTNGMSMSPNGIVFPIIDQVKKEGKDIKIGELITRILAGSGIQDWTKIVIDQNQDNSTQLTQQEKDAMAQHQDQLIQALSQMTQGGINNIPAPTASGMTAVPQGSPPPPPPPPSMPAPPQLNDHGLPNLPQLNLGQ